MRAGLLPTLRGAAGGDDEPQQHTPTEASDTLQSKAFARTLHLLSEGPIAGLVNGYASVYFNDTPLFATDGTLNFQGTNVLLNAGFPHGLQSYFPGFAEVESEASVEAEVTLATPVVRTISTLDSDAVRVRIAIPGLQTTDTSSGDINGASVFVAVDLKPFGGAWTSIISELISGKASARYEKQYRVQLTGTGPWDIRVRRLDLESSSQFISNRLIFAAYTTLIDEKFTYPHSAVAAVTFEASQFRQTPTIAFHLRGRLVMVPSNYNPTTRIYTGVWSGTLVQAYSNNPAWCFYDMVTNDRFGLGDLINTSAVDTAALYALGQYCDALVPNGAGGTEPRYTLNVYIQTQEEAWKVLSNLVSIANAMIYGGDGGGVTIVADRPSDAVMQYSEANVIGQDGAYFEYSGSARDARHNAAIATWNNPAEAYRQALEPYRDEAAIVEQGYREMQFAPMGCTSQGQALRAAKWAVVTEQRETDTVSFRVGLDSAFVRPGNVFRVQDPKRTAKRFAGRLIGAQTTTLLAIDAPVTIESGKTYQAAIMLPSGALSPWKTVTNGVGATSALALASALAEAPAQHAIWMVQANDLAPTAWRCLSVQEDGRGAFAITGLAHDSTKYAFIESNLVLPAAPTNILIAPGPIIGLALVEALVLATGAPVCQISVSWEPIARASGYYYQWRRGETAWSAWATTSSTGFDLTGALPGAYYVQVFAFNFASWGPMAGIAQTVIGLGAIPADVPWLLVNDNVLSWGHVDELDVRVGGGYDVRRQSGIDHTWGTAERLFAGLLTSSPIILPSTQPSTQTILIKAVDSSGNYSNRPTTVVRFLGDAITANLVDVADFRVQGWPGTIMGGTIVSGEILADNPANWYGDPLSNWYGMPSANWYAGIFSAMSYTTDRMLVALQKADAVVTFFADVLGDSQRIEYSISGSNSWYGAPEANWYGAAGDDWYPWSESDFAYWGNRQPLDTVFYRFRVSTLASPVRGWIREFRLIIDYADIEEYFNDLLVDAGGTRLPIARDYISIKNVQITLQSNTSSAVTAEILDKNAELGPLIKCFTVAHAAVGGALVDARIKGY